MEWLQLCLCTVIFLSAALPLHLICLLEAHFCKAQYGLPLLNTLPYTFLRTITTELQHKSITASLHFVDVSLNALYQPLFFSFSLRKHVQVILALTLAKGSL